MQNARFAFLLVLFTLLFVTALPAQQLTIVRPKDIDEVLVNPGIGFMTLNRFNGDPLNEGTSWTEGYPIVDYPFSGKLEVRGQPLTSIAYLRIYWKFIEPEMGKYNWALLDQALKTAHARGQTLMLRVAPYGPKPVEDAPDWYRKLMGDESGKNLPGKWRSDPENPAYIKPWTALVRALGQRYDGHPDLELVDVSIVGFWGEGENTEMLSEATMKVLVDSYLDSFHKTPLVMQPTDYRTNTYALSRKDVGWRADCLGDMRCTTGRNWCHMFDAYPQAVAGFGIADSWKKGPVTLEACGVMQGWRNQGWDLDYIIEQSLKWHISSFNNKSSAVPKEWRPKVDQWLKKMGYRFVLRKFTYPAVVRAQGKLEFATWWENKGVAPIYRRYLLALRLKNGGSVALLPTVADIRTWLPGDAVYDDGVFIPAELPAGDYDLGIALLDPRTREPKVKLAIEGRGPDGWYTLGKIRVE